MANNQDDFDDDFAADLIDPAPREDGKAGPPDDWMYPSWFDVQERDWYWKGRLDPCPVRPRGYKQGDYIFVTASGEIRTFTSNALHGRGGLPDLFGGSMAWPMRHFRKYDLGKKELTGGLQVARCGAALIRLCRLVGLYDDSHPVRGVGVWRGPDGRPLLNAGDRVFHDGYIEAPGVEIEDAVYVVGGTRQAPAYINGERGSYEWAPAGPDLGRIVTDHLDGWHWREPDDRDLFQGSQFCNWLGAAPLWLPHVFVRAPYGSGKSSLLRYARALAGGGAHPVQRTYSKAHLEQAFAHTAAAIYLDEMESDTDAHRIRGLFELIRLLSDDGAEGGRGTSSGKGRRLDLHGAVTMAATVSEEWKPQDRSRIAYLELQSLKDRRDRPPAPPEVIAAQLQEAAKMSPALRARAIAKWDLFRANLSVARSAILGLGGQTRDADQLGHLIAGWWTMIRDEPLQPDCPIARLERFRSYIVSLTEEEEGEDEPSLCLNTIFGLSPDKWVGGERVTIGQIVALAREEDGSSWRRTLLPYGLMLIKHENEGWRDAWLAVANRHPGLDELLAKYPQYQGKKRRQILGDLRRTVGDVEHKTQPGESHTRIGGTQTRFLLVPPVFLPLKSEEAI